MRLRTAAIATALVSVAATGALGTTHADAQRDTLALVNALNSNIATLDCNAFGTVLRGAQLVGPDTTRGQLVDTLNSKIATDPTFKLVSAPTVNAVGDRALACGVVKKDPVTPQSQAIEIASKLSSQAGLPEARNVLPALSSQ